MNDSDYQTACDAWKMFWRMYRNHVYNPDLDPTIEMEKLRYAAWLERKLAAAEREIQAQATKNYGSLLLDLYLAITSAFPDRYPCDCPPARQGEHGEVIRYNNCVWCRLSDEIS